MTDDPSKRTLRTRQRVAEWTKANPERYAENQRRWREANREKLRAYQRARRAEIGPQKRPYDPDVAKRRYENPEYREKQKARSKAHRRKDPQRQRELEKTWAVVNPERKKAIARAGWINRRSRMQTAGKISALDVAQVISRQNCEICGILHERMEVDHIIPISRGGKNHLSNLQLLCRPCNRSKWSKNQEDWLRENPITERNNC